MRSRGLISLLLLEGRMYIITPGETLILILLIFVLLGIFQGEEKDDDE
jgi:hypothetical protein